MPLPTIDTEDLDALIAAASGNDPQRLLHLARVLRYAADNPKTVRNVADTLEETAYEAIDPDAGDPSTWPDWTDADQGLKVLASWPPSWLGLDGRAFPRD